MYYYHVSKMQKIYLFSCVLKYFSQFNSLVPYTYYLHLRTKSHVDITPTLK